MYTFEATFPVVCGGVIVLCALAFVAYCASACDAEELRVLSGKPPTRP